MANNQNTSFQNDNDRDKTENQSSTDENAGVQAVKQADSLDGGKSREGGQKVGQFGDDEFMQTDQTITQAAPGQTATSETQGSSNV